MAEHLKTGRSPAIVKPHIIKPEQAKFVTAYLVDNSDTASKLSSVPVWTP